MNSGGETATLRQPICYTYTLTEDAMDTLPTDFWRAVWRELLGRDFDVPSPPTLSEHLASVLYKYKLLLIYIPPGLTEADYPTSFIKPDWEKVYERCTSVERIPLRGGWALVETIPKPDWIGPNHKHCGGYTDDVMIAEWDIGSRFELSWGIAQRLVKVGVSKLLELPEGSAQVTSVEEWNAVANLFNVLRDCRGMHLPDLGSTHSNEWCRNTAMWRTSDEGLTIGWHSSGGLANVGHHMANHPTKSTAYRFIVWLEAA
ncbi:MAG: hypothetical protein NUV56_00875 [Candidatus Uhrbacteria bacterium]|nr:hypothetical protein [Candidatus Uhrbacteria bacterium]